MEIGAVIPVDPVRDPVRDGGPPPIPAPFSATRAAARSARLRRCGGRPSAALPARGDMAMRSAALSRPRSELTVDDVHFEVVAHLALGHRPAADRDAGAVDA